MKIFGSGLDPDGGEVPAGREADPSHAVVETEAVLPPAMGSDAEVDVTDLARGRSLDLRRPGPAVFQVGNEAIR
jgi:hypothetical protein